MSFQEGPGTPAHHTGDEEQEEEEEGTAETGAARGRGRSPLDTNLPDTPGNLSTFPPFSSSTSPLLPPRDPDSPEFSQPVAMTASAELMTSASSLSPHPPPQQHLKAASSGEMTPERLDNDHLPNSLFSPPVSVAMPTAASTPGVPIHGPLQVQSSSEGMRSKKSFRVSWVPTANGNAGETSQWVGDGAPTNGADNLDDDPARTKTFFQGFPEFANGRDC